MVGETRHGRKHSPGQADGPADGRARALPQSALRRRVSQLEAENQALREQLALFQSVLENDDEGVVMAGLDNRYVFANRAAHAIFGFPPGRIIGLRPEDIAPPELHGAIAEHRELRKLGQASVYEVPLGRPDGTQRLLRVRGFPHEPQGQRLGSFSFITDITQARALETALRDSEERFRRLIENSPVGVYVGSGGQVAYCNPELARMLGAEGPEQVVGTPVLGFIHPAQHAAAEERIAAYDAGSETRIRRLEQRLVRRDGREVLADVIITPFLHEGQPAVQVVMRDITARKAAEQALRASEQSHRALAQELAAANRELQAVGELRDLLVRMIVHDIRSPLAAMTLVLDGEAAGGEVVIPADEAALARQQLAYTIELCNQLLDIQRLQDQSLPLTPETAVLGETAQTALAPLLLSAEQRGVALRCSVNGLAWRTDHGLLRRVLLNLLNNALKHSPQGGEVRLDCDQSAAAVRLSISDSGPGIDPAEQQRVFQLFATAGDQAKRGHGIGLAFCKLAVEALGGTIELVSAPGRGSVFTVVLPQLAA
jgi:PAS domain S-box-containing protein